jgi:hypothetical protein
MLRGKRHGIKAVQLQVISPFEHLLEQLYFWLFVASSSRTSQLYHHFGGPNYYCNTLQHEH